MSRRCVTLPALPCDAAPVEPRTVAMPAPGWEAAWPRGSVQGAPDPAVPWRDPRRRVPLILTRQPVALQIAAGVYAHALAASRGAPGRGACMSVRVDGGVPPAGRVGPQGRAASAVRELEAAIGAGRLALGRRRGPDGVVAVSVGEVWLVRAVAVEWLSLREAVEAAGAVVSGHKIEAARECLVAALDRMSRCGRAMALFR